MQSMQSVTVCKAFHATGMGVMMSLMELASARFFCTICRALPKPKLPNSFRPQQGNCVLPQYSLPRNEKTIAANEDKMVVARGPEGRG